MSVLRKLIHVGMTAVPLVGWAVSESCALLVAGLLLACSVAVEAARRWWPWVNQALWHLLPAVFRDWEERRVLGSTWFSVGMLATLLLCGRDAGGTAVLCLAWGDPAAELVGRRWGGGRRKSLAGSLGCLLACLAAGALGRWLGELSVPAVAAGAVVATLAERWSPPPDDNVWMPLLSGLMLFAVQALTT